LGGFGGDSHREGTCWCRYEASDFVFVVCFGLNFMNVRELQREREREREREKKNLFVEIGGRIRSKARTRTTRHN
jgi:hypothetical protein